MLACQTHCYPPPPRTPPAPLAIRNVTAALQPDIFDRTLARRGTREGASGGMLRGVLWRGMAWFGISWKGNTWSISATWAGRAGLGGCGSPLISSPESVSSLPSPLPPLLPPPPPSTPLLPPSLLPSPSSPLPTSLIPPPFSPPPVLLTPLPITYLLVCTGIW